MCGKLTTSGASPRLTVRASRGHADSRAARCRPAASSTRAGADQRGRRLDVGVRSGGRRPACGTCARSSARARSSGGAGAQRRVEVAALRGGQQLDADDRGGVLGHRQQPARAVRRHRDVVLLVGRGRDRIDARRIGALLVLRHQRRGRHLRDHEAGVQPGLRASGTPAGPDSAGSTSMAMRRSASEPISQSASAIMSAAKATGSAWKLPPDSASSVVGEDQRVVGDAVRLDRRASRRPGAAGRAPRPSPAAGSAGSRGPARARRRRGARRGSPSRPSARAARRAVSIWPRWRRSAWMRGSNGVSEPLAASVDSAPVTSAARNSRSASNRPASA